MKSIRRETVTSIRKENASIFDKRAIIFSRDYIFICNQQFRLSMMIRWPLRQIERDRCPFLTILKYTVPVWRFVFVTWFPFLSYERNDRTS